MTTPEAVMSWGACLAQGRYGSGRRSVAKTFTTALPRLPGIGVEPGESSAARATMADPQLTSSSNSHARAGENRLTFIMTVLSSRTGAENSQQGDSDSLGLCASN